MTKQLITIAGACLLLSACGGTANENAATADANAAIAANLTPAAPDTTGFNAADACAILPREKVAQLSGLQVTDAVLERATKPTATTAGLSTCTYHFAGGGTLDFFARLSPVDDNTPDAIAHTKKSMSDMGGKVTDVPGLGTAAFEVDQMAQLHVFFAGKRYIYFMSMIPPANADMAEIERKLAKAVVG